MVALLLAVGAAWAPNYQHAGAWTGSSLESSPLFYNGQLLLMQSKMGRFAPDNLPHSYFCVYDGLTGEELSCPPSSSGHAFCSAIVDATPGRAQTLWTFCSAWDRATKNCSNPGPWGCGACGNPAASGGCYVGAWSCDAARVADCEWTFAKAITLPGNETVPNVGVGVVPATAQTPAALPPHQAFMALETAISVAINTGNDGDFSRNWQLLNATTFGVDLVSDSGLCPFARYDPVTAHYYVGGGGNDVNLARSPNLTHGSWEVSPLGRAIAQGCTRGVEDCSPGSPVARIADGYYTDYWKNGTDKGDREFLMNLTEWNWSVVRMSRAFSLQRYVETNPCDPS